MIELPPLVPAGVDVRNLAGFMLNVERLMASELWALSTGEEFKAAFALWCRAWKQEPAGSLPNDDKVLAAFSGAGARWTKIKSMALRGFILCSDGRLYNKTLCEDVLRASAKKAERNERTRAATEARRRKLEAERHDERNVNRDGVVTTSHRRDSTIRDEERKEEPSQGSKNGRLGDHPSVIGEQTEEDEGAPAPGPSLRRVV